MADDDEEEEDDDDDTYEVERIVSSRKRGKKGTEYLIKWKGYKEARQAWIDCARHTPRLLLHPCAAPLCRASLC